MFAHEMCIPAQEVPLDWDGLRMVLAIGRAGTLSAAGEALGVTHTTVGRRLARLEDELGVRLFDRTPEGYVPTEPGEELLQLARALQAQIQPVENRVRGRDTQLAGALRVATLDFLFEAFVDVFASFRERYPGVELTVTCSETEVSLFQRQADVALRMTNTPPETLVGRKVGAVRFALYGHRDLAAGTSPEQEPATDALNAMPWLHWDERLDPISRWMDGWLAQIAPQARIAIRLGENTLARRAAVRSGIGVHPLPCFEGDRYPELVRIGPVLEPFTRQLWLLTLPALRTHHRVRVFMDHLATSLADHPALAGGNAATPSRTSIE